MVDIQRSQKNKDLATGLLVVTFLLALSITFFVVSGRSTSLDNAVFDEVAPHRTPGRTRFMVFISIFGNHLLLIPANFLLLAWFLYKKRKNAAIYIAFVSLTSLLVMSVIKRLVHRQRPSHSLVDGITNYSFPSGHSFMTVTFYGLLAWWAWTYTRDKQQKTVLITLLLLFLFTIGFSRIYLQVHYLTDVLAGWSFGACWLLCSLLITQKWLDKMARRQGGILEE